MKQINFLFKTKIRKIFFEGNYKATITDEMNELESILHQTRGFYSSKRIDTTALFSPSQVISLRDFLFNFFFTKSMHNFGQPNNNKSEQSKAEQSVCKTRTSKYKFSVQNKYQKNQSCLLNKNFNKTN